MRFPSLPVIHSAFHEIDTHQKAYALGFLLADGCVRNPNSGGGASVNLRIKAEDIKACHRLQEIAGGHLRLIEEGYRVQWDVSSIIIAEDLRDLGITPNKTFTAGLNWHLVPQHLHGAVLAGIIDGDGHLRFNPGRGRAVISVVTASPILRDQLLEHFPFFRLRVQEACAYRKSNHYHLVVESNRHLLKTLIEQVYDRLPFGILDRKQVILAQIRAHLWTQDEYERQMQEVPRLKASGMTITEIAGLLGTSRRPIQECLKREGVDGRRTVFTPQDLEEMRRLHEAGMTVLEIHAAIGKGAEQGVRWHMQKMELLKRVPKPSKDHPQVEQIVAMHQEGLPAYQIAERLGLTPKMVGQVLRKRGFILITGSPQKLTRPLLLWALNELAQGRTLHAVAGELGVSETLIRTRRKELEAEQIDTNKGHL